MGQKWTGAALLSIFPGKLTPQRPDAESTDRRAGGSSRDEKIKNAAWKHFFTGDDGPKKRI
jgi:hypothetical protein